MPTVTVDLSTVIAAATALQRSARFDEALDLVDSVEVEGADRLALLMARAEVVAGRDHVRGVRAADHDIHPLDALQVLAAEVGAGPAQAWDLAMLALRREYSDALVRPDGSPWFGPQGRSAAVVDRMTDEAERMRVEAPDEPRRGWACMCLGWIADNLRGDRAAAPDHYTEALAVARAVGDDLLLFEAQRHLGDHAHDDGDHQGAVTAWQESAEAAARAGHLSGVLAQQLVLAVLARDAGDEAGARALAIEVGRWSAAIGAGQRVRQVEDFLAGVDPTRAPDDVADAS